MLQKILSPFIKNPKQLFILDGLGAMLSAFMLGVVLVYFQAIIGMPINTLYFLAAVPCVFILFNFFGYLSKTNKVRSFLKTIAYFNISYCFISLAFTFFHMESLTALGWFYFIVEILLVLTVAYLELQTAGRIA